MEPTRFDDLTKALATATSRRQALKAIAATTLGSILGLSRLGTAFGAPKCHRAGTGCDTDSQCCSGLYCANGEKCTPCPALPACNSGCPCPQGQTCSNGQCVTPPPQSQPYCLCSDGTALAAAPISHRAKTNSSPSVRIYVRAIWVRLVPIVSSVNKPRQARSDMCGPGCVRSATCQATNACGRENCLDLLLRALRRGNSEAWVCHPDSLTPCCQ